MAASLNDEQLASLPFNTICYRYQTDIIFRAGIQSAVDADIWLASYERLSKTHWIVRKTYPSLVKFVYRKDYVCHHAGFKVKRVLPRESGIQEVPHNRRGKSKKCECPASLVIKICLKTSKELYSKVSSAGGHAKFEVTSCRKVPKTLTLSLYLTLSIILSIILT